ncbi:MAG: energy transducer TonB [Myxococcales bacterium]|nr:energy transducer TonB [Myxococcales bacterium]HIK85219.1 energy transducer TonB [Myxococcales bacterium]
MARRYLIATVCTAFITFGLFWVMQYLVSAGRGLPEDTAKRRHIQMVRLIRDSDTQTLDRRKPERTPPPAKPPPPPLSVQDSASPVQRMAPMLAPTFDASGGGFAMGGAFLGDPTSDSDVMPRVRIQPQYPMRAYQRGVEGYVVVEFTIAPDGSVRDPVVIDSKPGSIFNRAAIAAVRKWKYAPKIQDGVAVERLGVQTQIDFEMDEG